MEDSAGQASVYRVNLIKEQLETLADQCRIFTSDSHCPIKINIFKRKLQTFTKEITHLFTIHDSEDVVSNLTRFQLECEDLLAELELFSSQYSRGPEQTASKLPTIKLTKFDGDILRWQEFYDTFCSNIDSRNLSDVDKMLYLKSVLEGKAKEVIEGIQATNLNYQIALKALRDRYGNKSVLIDSHYNALYSLKACSPDINECRRTYNEIERHLRVLSALGEDTLGNHLRTIIISKFPENFKYELHLRLKEDERTVGNIRSHLELLIRANEMSQRSNPVEQFTTEAFVSTVTSNPSDVDRHIPRKKNMNRKRKAYVNREPPKKKRTLMPCIFCQQLHYNEECPLPLTIRREKLKEKGKCYICLRGDGHISKNCKINRRCIHCKRTGHNRALCDKFKGEKYNPTTTLVSNGTSLQTAIVSIQGSEKDNVVKCRAIFDSGSMRSYITSSKVKQLKLKFTEENCLMIYTFGSNKPKEIISPLVTLNLLTKSGICKTIEANVIPLITERVGDIKSSKLLVKLIQEKFKNKIVLADDYSMGTQIDLLIGNDYYFQLVHNERKQVVEHLFLIKSDFGWLTSGRYQSDKTSTLAMNVVTYSQEAVYALSNSFATPDLPLKESIVNQIWELEALGITDSPKSKRDEEAVENFNHTIQIRDSRYHVTWPWIEFPPDLPTNYGLAFGRLKSLIKRLDQKSIQEYDDILNEQLKNNIIEVVPASEPIHQTCPPIHYIPHHIVHQAGKKGRIVYDASAKIKGCHSLNECLYKGPLMLEDLTALLINFRIHKVGITADIEKAFLQIGLQENDRDVTRFLWLKDTKGAVTPDNVIHMRFSRVPFGIISSPFLLTATIRYHINKRNPDLLQLIADKCYADNLVSGARSTEEAYELFVKTRNVFDELSMNIRDWISNDNDFMKKVPSELKSKDFKVNQCKVLGMLWNTVEDTMQLKYNSTGTANIDIHTKRDVLRILSSVYDPCGIVSPILMPIKLFLQDLWRQKIKWDTKLSEDLLKLWKDASKGLRDINEIKIPRYISLTGNVCELHCFTDAAEKAYVAVVYLRDSQTKIIYFVMSKSRIAPLKEKEHLKIPKLELLGVLIGSRLMKYISKSLQVSISRLVLWTDSQIVLSWIKGNKLLSPFIARRIGEIKQNDAVEFRYVPSKENPADIGTRSNAACLSQSIWQSGPLFLNKDESEWPAQITTNNIFLAGEVPTLVGEQDVCNDDKNSNEDDNIQNIEPDCDEETSRIRDTQKHYFHQEYIGKTTNISRSLQLYKDNKGLVRCKGRFQNADCSIEQKFPILLPREAEFTHSIIKNIHETNYHVGVSHTLALLRKRFWVPKGRSTVQKVIKKCVQCQKYAGGPFKLPPMPPLPKERVTCCPAFSYTGTDYMGPLKISSGDKRWICVLTCLSVRAIHMEVVHNLTAEEFNLAIRRFIAVRGLPVLITSDNATQMKLMADVITSNHCIENKVKWRFIPELAPWYGGFYERLMSLIKQCMKRTLEKHLLNDQQLLTIVKEIEAVLNTRPLTYVGDEVEHVLSPIDFLCVGSPVVTKSSEEQILGRCTNTKEDLIQGWKRGQKIIQEFSKMFIGQYLPYLRQRNSFHKESRVVCNRVPKVGEMVQIKGDSSNRAHWKIGKITELIKSRDGNIRVVKVCTDNGHILNRSIAHLYPLELDNESIEDDKTSESLVNNRSSESIDTEIHKSPLKETTIPIDDGKSKPTEETQARPQRKAAIKARNLLKLLTKQLVARQ